MHLIVNGEKQTGRAHFKDDKKKGGKEKKTPRREPIEEPRDYVMETAGSENKSEEKVFAASAPFGFDSIAEPIPTVGEQAVDEDPIVIGAPAETKGEVQDPFLADSGMNYNDLPVEEPATVTAVTETPAELAEADDLEVNNEDAGSEHDAVLTPVEAKEQPSAEEPKKGLTLPKKEKREKPVKEVKAAKTPKAAKKQKAAVVDDDILEQYADVELVQKDRLTFGFMIGLIALVMISAAIGAFFYENVMAFLKPFLGV